jgi:cysteine desulfurase
VSALEHPAVREQAAALKRCGWTVRQIPSTPDGFVTPEAVVSCLTNDTVLVCVMAVNNETGAIQNIQGIADVLKKSDATKRRPYFHVDCVQAAGKIPLDISYDGIDSAAFSAHKLCGPRGTGLLYLAHPIQPFLRGGGQEKNIRSGTENLFGASCFAACLKRYYISPENKTAARRFEEQKNYTARFLADLSTIKNCRIIPSGRTGVTAADRFSPWIIQAGFEGIPGQVMVRALSEQGFYISTGSACSARKNSRHNLEAMNVPPQDRETAVRFSFGPHTEEAAMEDLFAAVRDVCSAFS